MIIDLFVSPPVSMLQLDVDTDGEFMLNPDIDSKQILSNRLQSGMLRIIIFGLDPSVFSGKIGSINNFVRGISEVVGSNPDGTDAHASVGKISQIPFVEASIR